MRYISRITGLSSFIVELSFCMHLIEGDIVPFSSPVGRSPQRVTVVTGCDHFHLSHPRMELSNLAGDRDKDKDRDRSIQRVFLSALGMVGMPTGIALNRAMGRTWMCV